MSRSLRELLREAEERFIRQNVSEPRRSAEWLVEAAFGIDRTARILNADVTAGATEEALLQEFVERRLQHEPLQYIVGIAYFMDFQLEVDPRVLIPRPETEVVAEQAIRELSGVDAPRALDIGTGSGCLAIALARARRDGTVDAWDVSQGALELAEKNAHANGVSVRFERTDVLALATSDRIPSERAEAVYDLIVSNPPYIPVNERPELDPDVVGFEPHVALFCGSDPLQFYRAIAVVGKRSLKRGGRLVLETHADFGEATRDLLVSEGYVDCRLISDLAGKDRVAIATRP